MRNNRYRTIYKAYHPLYVLSRTVRYLADPRTWIPSDEIEGKVLGPYLYRIEASAFKLLGVEEAREPIKLRVQNEQ
ncbi:MAG: hypothetical protein PVI86_14090 [Phycisphaerae bacterium]